MSLKAYQIETDGNGALAMACQKAQAFADAERADGTRTVYQRAWKQWATWAEAMRTDTLPAKPEAIAAWLAELARNGKSVATVSVRLAAAIAVHRREGAGLDARHPAIRSVLAGIKRRCARPIKRARPMTLDVVDKVIAQIDGNDLRSLRDRALILVGYFAALRRSEIASLGLAGGQSPIVISDRGALLHIVGGKSRPQAETVVVPRRQGALCPVRALEAYFTAAGICSGPVFRAVSKGGRLLDRKLNAASIGFIVRSRTGHLGDFSAHGLRSGFVTDSAISGAPEHVIQRASRHRSVEVMRGYIREANGFDMAAANYIPPLRTEQV